MEADFGEFTASQFFVEENNVREQRGTAKQARRDDAPRAQICAGFTAESFEENYDASFSR
jgi:hypothetical protein